MRPRPTLAKVLIPQRPILDDAFLYFSDTQAVISRWIARQHHLYRLAEDMTLLTVAARFPWVMALAWKRGYRGPWAMVENIYRWERDR
jgi:hypothetical protein